MINDKSYIIDPLTTLCKLALLNFMPGGTKLSISHHILYIQEFSYLQGPIRKIYGDSRNDISNINTPLIKVIKWYIADNVELINYPDDETENSMKTIVQYAIKGLRKVQSTTYNDDMSIKIILQYFINMLTTALNGTWSEDLTVKNPIEGTILTDTIKNNYDPTSVNVIARMLLDADKQGNAQSNIIATTEFIHKLLVSRDTDFVNLMKQINTII